VCSDHNRAPDSTPNDVTLRHHLQRPAASAINVP